MAEITASLVKALRDKTGAGMMDCKAALTETKGDIEQAIDWLRKKGLSKAAKKADRVAADGLIGVTVKGATGAVVEVNSETDFVARNAQFQELVSTISSLAPKAKGDLAMLLAAPYPGKGASVDEHLKNMIATIGENMGLRRTAALSVADGVVADYVHNKAADGLGKIGVLVALESKGDKAALTALGRQIAMHIAAASPAAVNADQLDPALIERERAVYTEQAKASGKSARDRRQDGGGPPAQGVLPAGCAAPADLSGCRRRRQGHRGAGAQGRREAGGRAHPDRRLRALCPRRGYRQAGRQLARLGAAARRDEAPMRAWLTAPQS